MDTTELLRRIDELLASQFGDAPRQLGDVIGLALRAIQGKHFGEALSLLRQAQSLVGKKGALAEWRAEVAVMWALYYAHGGPELKRTAMWHKIAKAQRLEPTNKRLMEVVDLLNAQQPQK